MKIAITGGSGRIGTSVIALALAAGHELTNIDQVTAPNPPAPGLRFLQANVTDYAALNDALAGCDALIHLAAIAMPGTQPDHVVHANNVVGSYNALRAAAEQGVTRVCQASSINAIGASFSRQARFDYFPVDEQHPTYNEDPYSLSKWICEQQADSIARRYEQMSIASLRLPAVLAAPPSAAQAAAVDPALRARNLWSYTLLEEAARACLLAVQAPFHGHEVFFIAAPSTANPTPSLDLRAQWYPDVPLRGDLSGRRCFLSTDKAARLLGWRHVDVPSDT